MDPSTPTVPTTVSPAPKSSIMSMILSVFLCISLAGIGLLIFQNFQLKKQLASLKTATPSQPVFIPLEPVAKTDDPTANWKTYSNLQYGFSFKYPDTFQKEKETGGNIFFARDPNFSGGVGTLIPLSLVARAGENLTKIPSEWYINELISTKTLTSSELIFKEKTYKGDAAEGSKIYVLIAKAQNGLQEYIFEFSFTTDGCLDPSQEKIACEEKNRKFIEGNFSAIDQILSTFKFINQ